MKKKIFTRIFASFMAILIAFIGITTVITVVGLNKNIKIAKSFSPVETEKLKIENIEDGVWNIYSNRGLKVIQITDVHLGGGWMSLKKDFKKQTK